MQNRLLTYTRTHANIGVCPLRSFARVRAGFEHSIANMFYIPLGIFYKAREGLLRTPPDNSRGELLHFGTFLW